MEVDQMINKSLLATEASSWSIYLTGKNNFRYSVYAEYKAHRLKQPTPKYLHDVREHLVRTWGAIVTDGYEADDILGVEQMANTDTCICHIDKDINQIPGKHYHPGLVRKGAYIVEPHFYDVTPEQGRHLFYWQLLVGDSTDNIKGAPGIGPKKADNILFNCKTEWDYYNAVKEWFSCEEELIMNARCVKIWQKMDDLWVPPTREV